MSIELKEMLAYDAGYEDGKRDAVVRCRECKWYEADLCANPWGVCFHEDWVANNIGHTVDEDGFCYRGKRRCRDESKNHRIDGE